MPKNVTALKKKRKTLFPKNTGKQIVTALIVEQAYKSLIQSEFLD